MTYYLKCSKCGSEKFLPVDPFSWDNMNRSKGELCKEWTCANPDCGHVMRVGKIKPKHQKVILSPDEKVVE